MAQNLEHVNKAITEACEMAGRDPVSVTLVAVSKLQPVELIEEAVAAGHRDFGENFAQKLRDKMKAVQGPGLRWHFIGHLQKNKVKYVAGKVFEMHSLDSMELAEEMDRRARKEQAAVKALIEVNVAGEEQKWGVSPDRAAGLVKRVRSLPSIEVAGLMTMTPWFDDPEGSRPFYRALRGLRDRMEEELEEPGSLPELSMGLSHDFQVAIEEGATSVRVGTAIFGERER